ncbi:MAG: hypothetical protein HY721_11290 [Planctomycetes bacterium]|nr:hypothetical protein [Planctomycetota bacterium]
MRFGPRGTGKSTWLRQVLPSARWYDLLHNEEYVRLLAEPAQFRREVEALDPGWIVVDEVLCSRLGCSMSCGRNWPARGWAVS